MILPFKVLFLAALAPNNYLTTRAWVANKKTPESYQQLSGVSFT